jgi:hypothetical protein
MIRKNDAATSVGTSLARFALFRASAAQVFLCLFLSGFWQPFEQYVSLLHLAQKLKGDRKADSNLLQFPE